MVDKKRRIKNPDLLEESRSWPCIICGTKDETMAHHIKTVGSGGDDIIDNLLPICIYHHRFSLKNCHNTGLKYLSDIYPEVKQWFS